MRALTRVVLASLSLIMTLPAGARAQQPPPRPEASGAPAPAPPPGVGPEAALAPAPAPAATSAPATLPMPAAAAAAGPTSSEPEPENEAPVLVGRRPREKMSHKYQIGLSAMPGMGYRVIFPYKDGLFCGQENKTVCTEKLPTFLDLQAAFGITFHWDFLTDVRMGLERDFTTHKQLAIAPGFRYWVGPNEHLKFFTTVQGVFDHTPQANTAVKDNDLALRNANGMMYDLMRNVGLFFQFGETIGFIRWLRFELDGGVGLQLRLP